MSSLTHRRRNAYFLEGDRVSHAVLQEDLQKYLGPDATVRPGYSLEGRPGYIVNAYRDFTSEQLHDLVERSEAFEKEHAHLNANKKEPDYSSEREEAYSKLIRTFGRISDASAYGQPLVSEPPDFLETYPIPQAHRIIRASSPTPNQGHDQEWQTTEQPQLIEPLIDCISVNGSFYGSFSGSFSNGVTLGEDDSLDINSMKIGASAPAEVVLSESEDEHRRNPDPQEFQNTAEERVRPASFPNDLQGIITQEFDTGSLLQNRPTIEAWRPSRCVLYKIITGVAMTGSLGFGTVWAVAKQGDVSGGFTVSASLIAFIGLIYTMVREHHSRNCNCYEDDRSRPRGFQRV